jgi:competence protein ComEC
MVPTLIIVGCLAYVAGLLATGVGWGIYSLAIATIFAALVLPKRWRTGPGWKVWLGMGLIGLGASAHLILRTPSPNATDVSRFVPPRTLNQTPVVTTGRVLEMPRVTQERRSQLWLQTQQLKIGDRPAQAVSGKLYVTVPAKQTKRILPGQQVEVTGTLYKPQGGSGACAFDFKDYLAREDTFAGLSGRTLKLRSRTTAWGWWVIRQRIIQAQSMFLGRAESSLISAMVLGNRAVNLPTNLKDCFRKAGLAHALAASGFQISLILGVVLSLTRSLKPSWQGGLSAAAILIFAGLAGPSASVLRATLMGLATVSGLTLERKVKPVAALLVAATLLLIVDPNTIWDIGFQLSFAATLGLLVTVPPLVNHLSALPPAIASAIAVPVAATIWTLPIQLYSFCLVSLYCIPANLVTVPLISLISLGGFSSALAGMLWPAAGGALAWLLQYPTQLLIAIVQFFCELPGNSVAVGQVSAIQVWLIYGLIGLVWVQPWWQRRWGIAVALAIGLVILPAWGQQATLQQVTVLDANPPTIVIQDRGNVTLIYAGDTNTAKFTLLPFFRQQGINAVDAAIVTGLPQKSSDQGWMTLMAERLMQRTKIYVPPQLAAIAPVQVSGKHRTVSILQPGTLTSVGNSKITLLQAGSTALQLQYQGQSWFLPGDLSIQEQDALVAQSPVLNQSALVWSGRRLSSEFVQRIRPRVAIATGYNLNPAMSQTLDTLNISTYSVAKVGGMRWTAKQQFQPIVAVENEDNSGL